MQSLLSALRLFNDWRLTITTSWIILSVGDSRVANRPRAAFSASSRVCSSRAWAWMISVKVVICVAIVVFWVIVKFIPLWWCWRVEFLRAHMHRHFITPQTLVNRRGYWPSFPEKYASWGFPERGAKAKCTAAPTFNITSAPCTPFAKWRLRPKKCRAESHSLIGLSHSYPRFVSGFNCASRGPRSTHWNPIVSLDIHINGAS